MQSIDIQEGVGGRLLLGSVGEVVVLVNTAY